MKEIKKMKKMMTAAAIMMSTSTFANHPVIKAKIMDLAGQIAVETYSTQASKADLQKVKQKLQNSLLLLQGKKPQAPQEPSQPKNEILTAECHVDDDRQFDFDQQVSPIFGHSIAQMEKKCAAKAMKAHGSFGSSGLKNVASYMKYRKQKVLEGECHIDDDKSFDPDQHKVGSVYGMNLAQMEKKCADYATTAHGSFGSSAIMSIKKSIGLKNAGTLKATCHIDDDKTFDPNQRIVGEMYALTLNELEKKCAKAAKSAHGSFGTSAIVGLQKSEF